MEPIFLRGKIVVTDCNMNEACDDAKNVKKESLEELENLLHNAKVTLNLTFLFYKIEGVHFLGGPKPIQESVCQLVANKKNYDFLK